MNLQFRATSVLLAAIALSAVLLLPACSVNVKKNAQGDEKKVDIETPLGGIHVNEGVDARDTGLAVYPGAKPKEKDSSHDSKSANVNISGFGFGLKVVAIEYVSDDPPQKLVAYYKDELKKYGNVLECHTSKHSGDERVDSSDDDHRNKGQSRQLTCEKNDGGSTVELKVGTDDNQHIVAVEPNGKGSNFALVYVRTRGKDDII
jgi:hypothetical protein